MLPQRIVSKQWQMQICCINTEVISMTESRICLFGHANKYSRFLLSSSFSSAVTANWLVYVCGSEYKCYCVSYRCYQQTWVNSSFILQFCLVSVSAPKSSNNVSGRYGDSRFLCRGFNCFDRKDKWWCYICLTKTAANKLPSTQLETMEHATQLH